MQALPRIAMDAIFKLGDFELPADIMHIIMSKFSPEEISVFRKVSKNWGMSIRDKEFSLYYNKFSKPSKEHIIMMFQFGHYLDPFRILVSVASRYINKEKWKQLIPKVGFHLTVKFDVIGSIDGILCFQSSPLVSVFKSVFFVICNPVTGQTIKVEPPPNHSGMSVVRTSFAYNYNIKSYAIIWLWKSNAAAEHSWISVYETSTRAWSTPMVCDYDVALISSQDCYLNGKIYWFAEYVNDRQEKDTHIVSLNVATNEFHSVELPNDHRDKMWKLTTAQNRIAIISSSRVGQFRFSVYEVWRLTETKDESGVWEMILSVGLIPSRHQFICLYQAKFVFADPACELYDRGSKCAKKIYYISPGMTTQVKEIRGLLPLKFRILGCIHYRPSLSIF